MISGKFDPTSFFQQRENVALRVSGAELFGLLKRSLDLPASWAGMVRREGGDCEIVAAGGLLNGNAADEVTFVRVTPIEIEIDEDALTARDGFACQAQVRLTLRLLPERGELLAFHGAILGSRRVVQTEKVSSYLHSFVRDGLAKLAGEHDAATLTDARSCELLAQALAQAIEPACFGGGLVLESPPRVRFESGSFRRVQDVQHSDAARKAEHAAARQVEEALQKAREEHLDQLASTLSRLRELTAQSPEVGLPELIRTFSERQRGDVYEALFASESPASRTRWIVAAAGDELLFFDPANLDRPARRTRVEGAAGPARSVRPAAPGDGGSLLIGAATGVYVWPIDAAAPESTLIVADAPRVRGGFNAAVRFGDRVVGTHSELGIVEWNLDQPTFPRARFSSMTGGVKAVRDVEFSDGRLYCSIDDRVISWAVDDADDRPEAIYAGSRSLITAICPACDGVYAGNSDGDILYWRHEQPTQAQTVHRGSGRAAESLWLRSSQGVRQLLFADTSHRIYARVLDDTFTCHYEAGGQTLRRVEVADDLIVATNDLRDRLICWTPGKPSKPTAVIQVGALTGRTVQDVCLVPT